jgi:hypothetical protein
MEGGTWSIVLANELPSPCAKLLEDMLLTTLRPYGMLENINQSPGDKIFKYVEEDRIPSIMAGLLLDGLMQVRGARFGFHDNQLNV